MFSGASYSNAVENFKEIKAQRVEQSFGCALAVGQVRPAVESSLCLTEDVVNSRCCVEQRIDLVRLSLISECELIFEVIKTVVDRRSRQHKHFCFNAGADNTVEQLEIAVLARILVVLIGGDFTTVAEVMAFVNNHKVEVAPVDTFKVITVGATGTSRQVGVIENMIVEAVAQQRIVFIRTLERVPVVIEFLRAEYENTLVARLVILYYRERGESLAETHGVGKNTAIVFLQLIDDGESRITLEII